MSSSKDYRVAQPYGKALILKVAELYEIKGAWGYEGYIPAYEGFVPEGWRRVWNPVKRNDDAFHTLVRGITTLLPDLADQLNLDAIGTQGEKEAAVRMAIVHAAAEQISLSTGDMPRKPSNWIAAAKTMPLLTPDAEGFPVSANVLVFCAPDDYMCVAHAAIFDELIEWYNLDGDRCARVTHWTPLPDFPDEVAADGGCSVTRIKNISNSELAFQAAYLETTHLRQLPPTSEAAASAPPICVDCRYYRAAPMGWKFDMCQSPEIGFDLVRGDPIHRLCEIMRSNPTKCGESGQWFESSIDFHKSSNLADKS